MFRAQMSKLNSSIGHETNSLFYVGRQFGDKGNKKRIPHLCVKICISQDKDRWNLTKVLHLSLPCSFLTEYEAYKEVLY